MRRGMTLIEILVTISIMGIFGGIAYPSMRVIYQGISRNEKYAVQFEVARDALTDITEQLRAMTALPGTPGPTLVGTDGGDDASARDTLRFTASDRRKLGRGATVTVEYFVEDPEPDGRSIGVLRKRVVDADGAVHNEVVYKNVVGLNCEYREQGEWLTSWDRTGTPEAVRVTVSVLRELGVRPKQLYTAVRLPGGTL